MKSYCFVGYANHKKVRWQGKLVSPHIDSEILDRQSSSHSCYCLGEDSGEDYIDSEYISLKCSILDALKGLLLAGPIRFVDLAYIFRLYRPNQYFAMHGISHPGLQWLWPLWALRTFIVARHFAYLFGNIAKRHAEARVIVYYSAAMLGVVFAFRSRGKPVYEIQHGYIGPSHNAYNKAGVIGSRSYFNPSGYLVWDRRTSDFLAGLGAGHTLITKFRHLRKFASKSAASQRVILVTTQWDTELPPLLPALIDSFPALTWRFRLHPRETEMRDDVREQMARPNVETSAFGTTLADDLLDSAAHITVHSSVVHEAAALGVPSLFCDAIGLERFAQEIADGMAIFVDQADAEACLHRMLAAHPIAVTPCLSEEL